MEDDNIRVVLGCGHSVCEECQGKSRTITEEKNKISDLLHKCPFCNVKIDRSENRRLYEN